ncbi:hypothetical protein Droror1_Dr00023606 [Drosera rotundifolia]
MIGNLMGGTIVTNRIPALVQTLQTPFPAEASSNSFIAHSHILHIQGFYTLSHSQLPRRNPNDFSGVHAPKIHGRRSLVPVIFPFPRPDFSKLEVTVPKQGGDNEVVKTCPAAMGFGFAAGTTDGPGAFDFKQGDAKVDGMNIVWQSPKPILLVTGEMNIPYDWAVSSVSMFCAMCDGFLDH